jgi:hypothetical protein
MLELHSGPLHHRDGVQQRAAAQVDNEAHLRCRATSRWPREDCHGYCKMPHRRSYAMSRLPAASFESIGSRFPRRIFFVSVGLTLWKARSSYKQLPHNWLPHAACQF